MNDMRNEGSTKEGDAVLLPNHLTHRVRYLELQMLEGSWFYHCSSYFSVGQLKCRDFQSCLYLSCV